MLKIILFTLSIFIGIFCSFVVYANEQKTDKSYIHITQLSDKEYKNYLKWIRDESHFKCGGYYETQNSLEAVSQSATQMVTQSKTFNYVNNTLILGEFEARWGNQSIKSNQLKYDQVSQMSTVSGNTVFSAKTIHFFTRSSIAIDMTTKSFSAKDIIFSIPEELLHGKAKRIEKKGEVMVFYDAEFTSCSPHSREWVFSANKFTIDNSIEEGNAQWVILKVKKVPVFIMPYFHIFFHNKRKSGFLFPKLTVSDRYKTNLNIPIYWNIKENIDYTANINLYQKFDSVIENEFRYLDSVSLNRLYYFSSYDTIKDDKEKIEVKGFMRTSNYFDNKLKGNLTYFESTNPTRHSLLDNYFAVPQYYPMSRYYNLKFEDNHILARIGKINWAFNSDLAENATPFNLDYYLNLEYQNQIPKTNLEYRIDLSIENFDRKNISAFTESQKNNGALVKSQRIYNKLKLLYWVSVNNLFNLNLQLINYTKEYNLKDYPSANNDYKKKVTIGSVVIDLSKDFNLNSDNISIVKTRLKSVQSEQKLQGEDPIFYEDYQIINYQTVFDDNLFFDKDRIENNSYSLGIEYLNLNDNRSYTASLGKRVFTKNRLNYISDETELERVNQYNAEPTTLNLGFSHSSGLIASHQTNYSFEDKNKYLSNLSLGYQTKKYSTNAFYEKSKNYYATLTQINNKTDEQEIYGVLLDWNYNEIIKYKFTQEFDYITREKTQSIHNLSYNFCCWRIGVEYINRTNLEKYKVNLNLEF